MGESRKAKTENARQLSVDNTSWRAFFVLAKRDGALKTSDDREMHFRRSTCEKVLIMHLKA